MKTSKGFTLVELLVVIAIIIILAAILFPVFAGAREKAQQAKCINNLKQISTAIAMYEDDYDNIMPFSIYVMPNGTGAYAAGYMWKDLMEPYVKQLKGGQYYGLYEEYEGELMKCPSAPIEEFTTAIQVGRTYGYNFYLWPTKSTMDVKYPGSTLRITECCMYDPDNPNAVKVGGSMQAPTPAPIGGQLWAPGWHNGMNIVLWVDGHVGAATRQRVMLSDTDSDPNVWCRLSPKPAFTPDG